jgi:hypothetical protein
MANGDTEGLTKRLLKSVPKWVQAICGSVVLVFLTASIVMAIPNERFDKLLGIEKQDQLHVVIDGYERISKINGLSNQQDNKEVNAKLEQLRAAIIYQQKQITALQKDSHSPIKKQKS